MNLNELQKEIQTVFLPLEMPANSEIAFHSSGCQQCNYLAEDLEYYRLQPINGDVIRLVHQEMSCLSAKAYLWITPHYLTFCLDSEAEYDMMETQFLIYNLSPNEEFKEDTLKRLSCFNRKQIDCLTHFMEWLKEHPHWSEYCPNEINKALLFLQEMKLV